MISCFIYSFSEYEIDIISNSENDLILNAIPFKANDNKEYELVIKTKGYYITHELEPICEILPYEKGLLLHTIGEIKLGKDHSLYVLLNGYKNVKDKRSYHIAKSEYIIREEIDDSYIKALANVINFSDDDYFFELCFLYSIYRLKNIEKIDLNLFFRGKLEYYGYDNEDFINKTPFNNSENTHFLAITNLAFEVLFEFATYDKLNLKEFSLTKMKLRKHYLKYFYSKI